MKSFINKLIAFTFVIALATGCASVTDAGLETQPEQPVVEQHQVDNPGFDTDADMDPIYDKP